MRNMIVYILLKRPHPQGELSPEKKRGNNCFRFNIRFNMKSTELMRTPYEWRDWVAALEATDLGFPLMLGMANDVSVILTTLMRWEWASIVIAIEECASQLSWWISMDYLLSAYSKNMQKQSRSSVTHRHLEAEPSHNQLYTSQAAMNEIEQHAARSKLEVS